jgi:hypothetical protein
MVGISGTVRYRIKASEFLGTVCDPINRRQRLHEILDSGLVDHEMVAGVRFELTTFGLCDLTQLSLRVGLYLHPA